MTKTYFKTYLEKWKILCKSGTPVKKLSMPKNGPPDETEYVQWATAFERGLGTTFFHLLLPGSSHGQTRNLESELKAAKQTDEKKGGKKGKEEDAEGHGF